MDRNYWEKIAPDYEDEIFDVLKNDKKGLIVSAILEHASPSKTVIDAGCAIGKWLPVLSPHFNKVIASDISKKNLDIARKKHPALSNINYLRADLSAAKPALPKADTIVCINAILTDSMKKRDNFFHNLSISLREQGHLILVVPSLESWLMTRIVQRKWKIDKELFNEKIPAKQAQEKYENIQDGNADIDNVPTKHYLREELHVLLNKENLIVGKIEKIEYEWTTEFIKPPQWLNEPKPWDWMVVARKV